MPAGSLVVLTAEGAVALGPDVADAPEPELSRAVYDQMCTLGLRQEILTALVFVIEADGQEVGGRLARAGISDDGKGWRHRRRAASTA
jgi:hypothetical protein